MLKRRKRRRSAVFLIFVLIIGAMFYDSNTRLVTEEFTVASPRLPAGFDGLRIVQLSDLHNTEYGEENEAFLSRVRAARPDLIAVTGDIIDGTEEHFEEELAYIRRVIPALCAIAPVYYVSGNHEWAAPRPREVLRLIADCGATVLRNEYVLLTAPSGEKLVLAGVDDPNGPYDMKTPEELVGEVRAAEGDGYLLMLAHRHDRMDQWAELGVDLVLCGHAHGGMIRLPFTDGLYAPGRHFFPTYTDGLYEKDGTVELVSRGVGGTKLRFLNNPEILVAILKKA